MQTIINLNTLPFKTHSQLPPHQLSLYLTQDWTEINAYYLPSLNTLLFPMGFLMQVVDGMSLSLWYGSIGVIYAHEVGHSFDSVGLGYDSNGRYIGSGTNPGNSDSSTSSSTSSTGGDPFEKCFEGVYENYEVSAGGQLIPINATLTYNEDFSDFLALQLSLLTYQSTSNQTPYIRLPGLTTLSEIQLYYLGYAQLWCSVQEPSVLLQQAMGDVHLIPSARVNIPLSMMKGFREGYNCSSGAMVQAEEPCFSI